MFQSTPRILFSVVFIFSLITLPAHGQPAVPETCAGLFISEYVEGSSNNKALELFNGTGAAIDLAAEGYQVEFYFNGSATPGAIIPLTGAVANGDVYVLADNDAAAAVLAAADQIDIANFFNGNDAVVLKRGSTVVDVIGQVGVDPGSAWGSGLANTVDHTLRRKASVSAGDADGSLLPQVAGAEVWHINADEPRALDYNEEFKSPGQLVSLYSSDAYRSSDHDPLLVRLQFGQLRSLWLLLVQV